MITRTIPWGSVSPDNEMTALASFRMDSSTPSAPPMIMLIFRPHSSHSESLSAKDPVVKCSPLSSRTMTRLPFLIRFRICSASFAFIVTALMLLLRRIAGISTRHNLQSPVIRFAYSLNPSFIQSGIFLPTASSEIFTSVGFYVFTVID